MAVNIDGDGLIALGGTSSTQGRLRLAEDTDNGTNYIELTAPASVASNRTITLPDNTGTMLTSASSITASQLPAGSVLQVVQGTTPTAQDTTTSTSFVASSLYATITPSSASSKIFMIAQFCFDTVGNNNGVCAFYRDSTILTTSGVTYPGSFYVNPISTRTLWGATMIYYDSPSSTSAIVYKVYFRSPTGAQVDVRNDLTSSYIILMEIAA